jgi:CheY-like chemotaxis protein
VLVVGNTSNGRGEWSAVASTSEEQGTIVRLAGNRNAALAMLRQVGKYASAERPSLVLLDVALDGEPAWLLLDEIKSDADLSRIPVIVLGAENSRDERERAYRLRANSYVPSESKGIALLIEHIREFWLMRVRLPVAKEML